MQDFISSFWFGLPAKVPHKMQSLENRIEKSFSSYLIIKANICCESRNRFENNFTLKCRRLHSIRAEKHVVVVLKYFRLVLTMLDHAILVRYAIVMVAASCRIHFRCHFSPIISLLPMLLSINREKSNQIIHQSKCEL